MSSERAAAVPEEVAATVPEEAAATVPETAAAAVPRTIIELVTEVSDRLSGLQANPEDPVLFQEAEELAKLASKAIKGGHSSSEWIEYMSKFVDQGEPLRTKQLARLLAVDNTNGDEEMDRRRAYLLSNAVCGGTSTGNGAMINFQVAGIDNGL